MGGAGVMRGEGYPSAELIELCRSNISSFVDYPALRSRPLGGRSLRAAVSEDHAGVCTAVLMSFTVFLWENRYEGCALNRVIRFNKTRGRREQSILG